MRESEVCDLGHFFFYFNHFTKNSWCEIYFYESEKVSLSFHFAPMVVERYMFNIYEKGKMMQIIIFLFIFFLFQFAFMDLFRDKLLREPLTISVVLQLTQQFSGINAVRHHYTVTFSIGSASEQFKLLKLLHVLSKDIISFFICCKFFSMRFLTVLLLL